MIGPFGSEIDEGRKDLVQVGLFGACVAVEVRQFQGFALFGVEAVECLPDLIALGRGGPVLAAGVAGGTAADGPDRCTSRGLGRNVG